MTSPDARVHVSVASQFENIQLVESVVDDLLQRIAVGDDSRHWITLAVREAVANAIQHGNHEDPDKEVQVEARLEDDELVIEIHDQGDGFNPSGVRDPLAPENLLKPGGRGIFYMRKLMDDVDYRFKPAGGTVVVLRKRIG